MQIRAIDKVKTHMTKHKVGHARHKDSQYIMARQPNAFRILDKQFIYYGMTAKDILIVQSINNMA